MGTRILGPRSVPLPSPEWQTEQRVANAIAQETAGADWAADTAADRQRDRVIRRSIVDGRGLPTGYVIEIDEARPWSVDRHGFDSAGRVLIEKAERARVVRSGRHLERILVKTSVYRWPLAALAVLAVAFLNPAPWDNDRLLGGVPINLVYHLGLCLATAAVMWVITRKAWPTYLDRDE